MSRFFAAIVPWILYALMSQAYPMAVSTTKEGQTQPASAPETIPHQLHDSSTLNPPHPEGQTVSASAPVSVHVAVHPAQGQCPPNTTAVPCTQCQCPANTEPSSENTEPNKKTGLWNGVKKLAYLCANSIYEGLVGENGYLTNLPEKVVCGPAPKKPKKESKKSSGNVRACCIFNEGGPPVKHDESDDDETANSKTVQLPPINFVYIRNRISTPGVPAPIPIVPGAQTKHEDNKVNCCCIGERLFNVSKLWKWIFKPQVNICAGSVNVNGIEIN